MEWALEIALVVLLAATLLQATRLERALGVLKRDRASLESLVAHFNTSTHEAECAIQRLHDTADGAGRDLEGQLTKSVALHDELGFLTERGDRLADRLDALVRAARPVVQNEQATTAEKGLPKGGSQVERNLLRALRMAR